ncbi:hypothetical protein P4C99_16420 [Pontiellaceae bacterium B1224]|nr:hypothetical protein [Pontiellaceae bacterium B1224]
MKYLLILLASMVIVSGCQTTPQQSQQHKCTVQLMELVIPSDLIEPTLQEQVWASDPSHFKKSTMQDNSIQYVGIKQLAMENTEEFPLKIEEGQKRYTDIQVVSDAVEKMMVIPEINKSKLPAIQLAAGEQFIDDTTEMIELPIDYDVVDGKTIIMDKETFRVGRSIDIHLIEVADSIATYNLKLFFGQLMGFDTYTLSNGDKIEMPWVQSSLGNTQYTQPLDTWYIVGGFTSELIEDGVTNEISHHLCARLTVD